ncbi:hypothetical protein PAPHI01_2519 [Pancytospora philotis]|nr:hypothetical protein PAPHI01_2519 [Pancytospora philotis]
MFNFLVLTAEAACASVGTQSDFPPSEVFSLTVLEDACNDHHESIMAGATDFAAALEDTSPIVEKECEEMSEILEQLAVSYRKRNYKKYLELVSDIDSRWSAIQKRLESAHQTLRGNLEKLYAIVLSAYSYIDSVKQFAYKMGYAGGYQHVELADMREFEALQLNQKGPKLNYLINTFVSKYKPLLADLKTAYKANKSTALAMSVKRHESRLRLYIKLMCNALDNNTELFGCSLSYLNIYGDLHHLLAPSSACTKRSDKRAARDIHEILINLSTLFRNAYNELRENDQTSLKRILVNADPQHALPSSASGGSSAPDTVTEDLSADEDSEPEKQRCRRC